MDHLTILSPAYIGISVSGTSASYARAIVKDCKVTPASSSGTWGMYLVYLEGGLVADNTVKGGSQGISLIASKTCIMERNIVSGTSTYGIEVNSSPFILLSRNDSKNQNNSDSDSAIWLNASNNCTVIGNVASGIATWGNGIYLVNSSGCLIEGNLVCNSAYGIRADADSRDVNITTNTASSSNSEGISIAGVNCNISHNIATSNFSIGIYLIGSQNTTVDWNQASGNGEYGIGCSGGANNEYSYNRCLGNGLSGIFACQKDGGGNVQ